MVKREGASSSAAFEEADLRAGLGAGGHVIGAFIVARTSEDFVVYLRGSWVHGRGFRIIRSYRGWTGDRSFKKLHSAWLFVRQWGHAGSVAVYPRGDSALQQFAGIAAADLSAGHGNRR